MEYVTDVLGPSHEHAFIAKNFVFLRWDQDVVSQDPQEPFDSPPSRDELTWLRATGFDTSLNWKKTINLDGSNTILLPLTPNQNECLLSTNAIDNEFTTYPACKHVEKWEVQFIVSARHQLIQNFCDSMTFLSNFNLTETWPLFQYIQDHA